MTARWHFMGIGGQGISAVAQMAQRAGIQVTGCDMRASATTKALEAVGIAVHIGHDVAHLEGVDLLVISPAVTALRVDHPELREATARGIPIVPWQSILGDLMKERCVLSVSGVHGKGTTTALLSLMLVEAEQDPTCEIGAVVPSFGANYRLGHGKFFINEADEYNHNFWHYHPRLAIVTGIEFEHPEFFADYEAFLAAFEHFIRGMDFKGAWSLPPTLILNADSKGCWDLWQRVEDCPLQLVTYSVSGSPIQRAENHVEAFDIRLDGETSFQVRASGNVSFPEDMRLQMQLPGAFNIENGLAALAAARLVGAGAEAVKCTVEEFTGTRRRFEIRAAGTFKLANEETDLIVVDDYAHHPTAIQLTLEAARRRYPNRRLVAVYQPHMYSRTQTFLSQFATAFTTADLTLIADIFPARERDTGLIHAREVIAAIHQHEGADRAPSFFYSGDLKQTYELLRQNLANGDLVVVMGAGDIYTVTERIVQAIQA